MTIDYNTHLLSRPSRLIIPLTSMYPKPRTFIRHATPILNYKTRGFAPIHLDLTSHEFLNLRIDIGRLKLKFRSHDSIRINSAVNEFTLCFDLAEEVVLVVPYFPIQDALLFGRCQTCGCLVEVDMCRWFSRFRGWGLVLGDVEVYCRQSEGLAE